MRYITLQQLENEALTFHAVQVFPESWSTRRSFSQYRDTPRPVSALFFVKSDIRVRFFATDGKILTAGQGDVVYIPAQSRYHVEVEGQPTHRIDTYTINFALKDENARDIALCERICLLTRQSAGLLDRHFERVSTAVHTARQGHANSLAIYAELYALLATLAALSPQDQSAYYTIRNGIRALQQDWDKNEKIEAYAALCGVSATYFYRCFREWAGQSPIAYRNALRISRAQTMLCYTDMPIREIAEVIGFEDPFYFCRVFSKQTGVSPREYRKTGYKIKDQLLTASTVEQ